MNGSLEMYDDLGAGILDIYQIYLVMRKEVAIRWSGVSVETVPLKSFMS
jgi:hypothetical protein